MRDREAMQALLARARARVEPSEFGLAPRGDPRGRKVAGLTHEHMTRLLGWPEHKYGYVERGRLAVIETELLEPIARILHLSDHEWEALVLYATGVPPAYRLDPQLGRAVPSPWERVLHGSREMAYVNDAAWDVVAYNAAFARVFRRREVPGNVMRWMLLHPEARVTLGDWEHSWLPLLVPQLRAAVAANPHNRTLAQLQADAGRDPVVARVLQAPPGEYIGPRAENALPLLHSELGPGWATLCAAGPFGVPGGRLMFVLFDQGERPQHAPALSAPASGPVDPDPGDADPGDADPGDADPGDPAPPDPAPPHAQ
ncbi:MmyB family transcriptional regulator [Actinacidiphila bryophytorum]|uniref:Helix-turn-helix domain-containing protein n=1 Tax=Actinacidiphila bryophytorum TaxID=1436133 RepID=A0A9W4H1B9_9ACTN|nr:helix-turn-helix domain-containing protein [Actinacidiphila bryophytorum]MBM9434978.1 helix-turn-helix domain-containing protein [Actinacidiphila bryophytorum]MBN6546212.1 helix-turn-helix domain-containing protein [Actinacidiphila bryophytorum]CAG7641998.1 Helix-turn-helix domain-containing protein [Actinacidiphila bryophytorum]